MVTVYDFGVAVGAGAFLIMELLQGTTLREQIRICGKLAPQRTAGVMRGICAAVDAAHQQRLIHRDLKPDNVFLVCNEMTEIAKVLDFGVAKFLRPSAVSSSTATQTIADTQVGAVVGTLAYMVPEQLAGDTPGPGWDLWALAVIAYEMLTGARPFDNFWGPDWYRVGSSSSFYSAHCVLAGVAPDLDAFLCSCIGARSSASADHGTTVLV